MFGNLFGSKKPVTASTALASKARRVNIEKRFSIIAETGAGSMSHVYKAYDNQAGRTVCLKVQDAEKSAAAVSRASLTGRISEGEVGLQIKHPNVVRTFEHGDTTKGAHYVLMEYIEGVSLTYVRQSRILTLAQKVEFLAQAADGLAALHAAGFIHHDVGPKNYMVDREDNVKLIDFGLSVPNIPAFQRGGNRTGTLQYMAPEVIRREPKSERIDIFSFGVMMFEMFTNKFPYDATDPMAQMTQRINGEPTDIDRVAPNLPENLKAIIRKTLTKAPENRWPSMSSLAKTLHELPIEGRTPKSSTERPGRDEEFAPHEMSVEGNSSSSSSTGADEDDDFTRCFT
jgi:serine/threonine protein kinase